MGATAGSWAGLHGPGEKTIEKTGQSGPGLYKGLRLWNRGPGQRAAGRPSVGGGPGCQALQGRPPGTGRGLGGPTSTAARGGCPRARLPSLGA